MCIKKQAKHENLLVLFNNENIFLLKSCFLFLAVLKICTIAGYSFGICLKIVKKLLFSMLHFLNANSILLL